uniref:Uncharacterized protein n=1 Tax=Glossina palpalis gambiensis TaxID=67801 RepID=A0A1B0AVY5_9MUSC
MSNRSGLLKKATNTSKKCSTVELNAINPEPSSEYGTVHIQSEASKTEDIDKESPTNNENENVVKFAQKKVYDTNYSRL